MWTRGELNPQLSNANAMLYRLTTSPSGFILARKTPHGNCGVEIQLLGADGYKSANWIKEMGFEFAIFADS